MPTTRRSLLSLALAAALPPAFAPHVRAADVDRFALGVASGSPRPTSVVLWTRLVGDDLPERVEVQWEVARDEAFADIAARGSETAERAWAHSVHAQVDGLAPSRWYWYRFIAAGARSPSAARAPRRRRTRSSRCASPSPRASTGTTATTRPSATWPREDARPGACSSATTSTSGDAGARRRACAATAAGRRARSTSTASATRSTRATRDCSAHAAAPWLVDLGRPRGRERLRRRRGARRSPRDFLARRAAAYQAY